MATSDMSIGMNEDITAPFVITRPRQIYDTKF